MHVRVWCHWKEIERTIQAARRSSSAPAASAAAALACVGEEARMDSTQPPAPGPICRHFLRMAARGGGYGRSGAELGGTATAASAGAGTTTPCFVIRLVAGRSIEGKALVVSGEPSNG